MKNTTSSKIITISLNLHDILNDPLFFNLPGEVSEKESVKIAVLKKYHSNSGILEAFYERDRLILQWYPEKIDDQAEKLHDEALLLAKSKNYDQAIEKWQKAILINEFDVEYFYKLGLVYYELRKYSDSTHVLEHTLQICPIHQRAHLMLGIDWIKIRNFDKAEKHLNESRLLNKSNILSYLNLGAIYSIKRRYNDAIEMFNSVVQLAPKDSRAYLGLARIYNMLNDVEVANNYFKKVIELSPGSTLAEFAVRSIHLSEKQEGSNLFTKERKEERLSKGIGFYLSGNYYLSGEQYKEYLKYQPSDDYVWYLFGESKIRSGNIEEAADCFKRSIRLNANRGLFYKSLGMALHYLGKSGDAIEILKKAIEMGKKDPLSLTLYGINLMRERKISDSINQFKIVIKKDPNNPLAVYNLALAYIQSNEKKLASSMLNKIITLEYFAPIKELAKKLLKNIDTMQQEL